MGNIVKHLKYKIVDKSNNIIHYSYNKQKAERWIKNFGKKDDIYSIEKLSKEELDDMYFEIIRWNPNDKF